MASEVQICNQAISWLGGNKIISLDDDTTEGRLCKANYALLRDACIEEGKWTFATKRFRLVVNPTSPPSGYSHRFEIPSTVLVVIMVTPHKENKNQTEDFDWRREETFIVADHDGPLYAKCIVRITDTTKFTATFVQSLAARIAADIASPLTESSTKEDRMWTKYNNSITLALGIDGMQGKSDRLTGRNSRLIRRR